MDDTNEAQIAQEVERQLGCLADQTPLLHDFPIAPLHGVEDLIRLELALARHQRLLESDGAEMVTGAIRTILGLARARLQGGLRREAASRNRPA